MDKQISEMLVKDIQKKIREEIENILKNKGISNINPNQINIQINLQQNNYFLNNELIYSKSKLKENNIVECQVKKKKNNLD